MSYHIADDRSHGIRSPFQIMPKLSIEFLVILLIIADDLSHGIRSIPDYAKIIHRISGDIADYC